MTRRATVLILMMLFGTCGLRAAAKNTALTAARFLPPEEYPRIARIAACEGTPDPERWHILVYDPRAEHGVRDYVVADGAVVTRNLVSQFAEELHPDDVIGVAVRVDSDRAALIARYFAAANRVSVTSLNYELRKDALGRAPVWKITCLDANQVSVGWIIINALDESVIARAGFPKKPQIPGVSVDAPNSSDLEAVAEGGFHPPGDEAQGSTPRPNAKKADARVAASGRDRDVDPSDDVDAAEPPRRSSSSRSRTKSRRTEVRRAEPVSRIVTKPIRIVRGILDF